MSTNVAEVSEELVKTLHLIMDVNATRETRAHANQFLEEFKASSSLCANCGFHIVAQRNLPMVRHFGLLLIEHCIQHQWNSLSLEQKVFIKENLMKLIADGTLNILQEQYHFKNALAKTVVEIIKREWPQHWPAMLNELYNLSSLGETQTELVLLIFSRLAEDVVGLQTVHIQRRRDIYQGLTSNLKDIFAFFTEVLQTNIAEYQKWKYNADGPNVDKVNTHIQVIKATLATLVDYLDWIPVNHLLANDGVLLKVICGLLGDDTLKYSTIECLLMITGRKGKPEERKPLLILFNSDHMTIMFNAASSASNGPIQETNYFFLKRICQVFINLGNLLCALWGPQKDAEFPSNFLDYLEAMRSLTSHTSQVLSSYAVSLWVAFFRHEHVSKDSTLLSFIPSFVEPLSKKLIKVGFPSRTDSPSCDFSRLDFDSDDDFNSFFLKFRNDCSEALRQATALAPSVTFECVVQWLEVQLQKPIDSGNGIGTSCSMLSPTYLEWDALAVALESVVSKIYQMDALQCYAEVGIRLLEKVLFYHVQDPLVLSATLSCISALFLFLKYASPILTAVVDRIFSTLVFSLPGQTKQSRSRAVKNVRRHACSCFVKLCKLYPELLLPMFDKVYEHVENLSSDPNQLSQMEKCTLVEALILISNEFKSFERQSDFLKEVIRPISEFLLCEDLKIALSSAHHFMTFIGLNQPPVKPGVDDLHGINRSKILHCMHVVLAIIKRSKFDFNVDGAFKCGSTSPNPALEILLPLFEHIFQILRLFNSLCIPEIQTSISPQYAKANDMLDFDKNNVLGISAPCLDVSDVPHPKTPLERMQNFFTGVHDACYHILGNCCIAFGNGFYSIPNLSNCIKLSIFCDIKWIPDYRLRPLIRVFMKPFVQFCPPEMYKACVIPVLGALCPFMYQKLSQKWAHAEHWQASRYADEDNLEAQEVLEDQVNRQLTREYMYLLDAVMQGRKGQFTDGEMMEEEDGVLQPASSDGMGELGQLIFKFEDLYPSVVLCIFSALSWNDATASIRASQLCVPIIKQLVSESKLGFDEAQYLFKCILMGLHQHGQHDSNVSLLLSIGLHAYELMRPCHSNLVKVMLEIPNCTEKDIQIFEEKISNPNPNKQTSEKKKKELFRSLVSQLIGKSVGEMFRQHVLIKDLPPLLRLPKKDHSPLESSNLTDIGLTKLFQNHEDSSTNNIT